MSGFAKLLAVILMCGTFISANDIDPMLIEPPKVSYEDMLEAAAKFNSFEFDEGVETLGYPSENINIGGFYGTSQYNVAMFRGIKYATAERFEKPTMLEKIDGLDVTAYATGPSCPQPSADYYENGHKYSEDCLYLDVYVPLRRTVFVTSQQTPIESYRKKRDVEWESGSGSGEHMEYDEYVASGEEVHHSEVPPPEERVASTTSAETTTTWAAKDELLFHTDLPVIIAFQGEEFTYAASRGIDGRVLARYGSAIVIVVNYRTGVLGFLSSGDERIKGNFGLYDQKVAIQWVKKYVEQFGGDPRQITLLGFSSGAESVSAQMLNPTNKDLFQKVVLQSGVAKQGTMFYNDEAAEIAVQGDILQKLIDRSGCEDDSVNCLIDLDTVKLITKAGELAFERKDNRTFGPIRDNHYFSANDSEGLLSRYDIMIGVVENEAGKWVNGLDDNITLYDIIRHEFSSNSYFHCAPETLVNFLSFEYRASSETDELNALQKGYLNLVNDYSYIGPAVAFANRATTEGAKTYFYKFQAHVSTMAPGRPSILEGMPIHGDDQGYLLGMPLILTELYTSSTRNISANYLRMVSNFAHSGNPDDGPTPKPSSVDSWTPFTLENMETFVISEKMEVKPKLFSRSMDIWSEAVTYLMSDDICPKVEVKKASCSVKSCKYIKDWEKNYIKWRDVDVPKWRQAAEKYGEFDNDDEGESCDKS
uniref:neuroligin-4, Y-linked-like n=1 Tax=Styela clava TaxID=7725 RepID=UPI00193A9A08|nr:neuroligin-4, Y-linked-like [Styela clava]